MIRGRILLWQTHTCDLSHCSAVKDILCGKAQNKRLHSCLANQSLRFAQCVNCKTRPTGFNGPNKSESGEDVWILRRHTEPNYSQDLLFYCTKLLENVDNLNVNVDTESKGLLSVQTNKQTNKHSNSYFTLLIQDTERRSCRRVGRSDVES